MVAVEARTGPRLAVEEVVVGRGLTKQPEGAKATIQIYGENWGPWGVPVESLGWGVPG